MLVEDNQAHVELIRRAFENQGNNVSLKISGSLQEARQMLTEFKPDVALVDLNLPDGKGVELLNSKIYSISTTAIVILTAQDDMIIALRAMRNGAQDYLVKGTIDGLALMKTMHFAIERNQIQQELKSQAVKDELTQVYNRRGLLTLSDQLWGLALRKQMGISLLMCDLDGMKHINDTHGHNAGDSALRDTSSILKECFRSSDIVARIGGDEFAVLAIASEKNSSDLLIQRLQEKIKIHNKKSVQPYELSISMGLAYTDPKMTFSINTMMIMADEELYTHKRARQIK